MNCNIVSKSEFNSKYEKLYRSNTEFGLYQHLDYLNAVTQGNYSFLVYKKSKFLPLYIKNKWGFSYVSMPPFSQRYATQHFNKVEFEEVIKFLQSKFWVVHLRVNCYYETQMSIKSNYFLDISTPYISIYDNYSSLLKKNLAKTINLEVQLHENITEIEDFFSENKLFKQLILDKFKVEFYNLMSIKSSEISYNIYSANVKSQKDKVAILITFRYKNIDYLLFPYTTIIGKSNQAMSFLIDQVIQHSDATSIDFEGSSIESIARFYEQFGAIKEVYYEYKYTTWPLSILKSK